MKKHQAQARAREPGRCAAPGKSLARHLLTAGGFFPGLTAEHRKALAERCTVHELRKGSVLFREGEHGSAIYFLVCGRVRLFKSAPDGQEVVLKVVGPGETFAEVVLFETDRYPVTAVAVTAATVLKWLRADVHRLLDDREFRNDFIAMLMRKQRYLADRVRDLATQNPVERLRAFLTTNFGPGPRFVVPIRKKQIAAALGIAPETFSRLIQRLRRNGVVEWRGDSVLWKSGS